MYEVTDCLYSKICEELLVAIGRKSFFSGSVTVADNEVELRITATIIVCRSAAYRDGCYRDEVVDLLPVWWDCHTFDCGEEVLNDFSFSELRRCL